MSPKPPTARRARSAAAAPSSRSARSTRRAARPSARSRRWRRYVARGMPVDRAGAELPAQLPRRSAGDDRRARPRRSSPSSALTFEEFLAREARPGRLDLPLRRSPNARCCTAIATRRPSTPWARSRPCSSSCPDSRSSRSNRAAAAWPAPSATRADTIDVSLAMGELSLLPAVRKARCRHADRRRRHLLPPPDPRRRRPRGAACRARAGDES